MVYLFNRSSKASVCVCLFIVLLLCVCVWGDAGEGVEEGGVGGEKVWIWFINMSFLFLYKSMLCGPCYVFRICMCLKFE